MAFSTIIVPSCLGECVGTHCYTIEKMIPSDFDECNSRLSAPS